MFGYTTLGQLPYLRDYESRRASSWDTTGANSDFWEIAVGESRSLLETDRPGCIRHIWMTVGGPDNYPRSLVLRMWWDGEQHPSVEVPLGDFFGIGFNVLKNFVSAPLQMSPEDGRGWNCWFSMPFDRARIEIQNECGVPVSLYFYIDYEEYSAAIEGAARFHAQWRREAETEGWLTEKLNNDNIWEVWGRRPNLDDQENYLILDAEGDGIYVGCNLNIDCYHRQGNDWYGEGDDMIVIDGEPWPPRLHGTGTEDYFCTAFGPAQEYCAPYHGITLNSGNFGRRYMGLIAERDKPQGPFDEKFEPGTVFVVDVAGLGSDEQDLVFAAYITRLRELMEIGDLGVDNLVVVVDELNKYAPSGGRDNYVAKSLKEIAARGRYLGLTLFGAQQFRSRVDKEIVGNAATHAFGHIETEELSQPGYGYFSPAIKEKLGSLSPGEILIKHPHFAQPIFVRFPRPACLKGSDGMRMYPKDKHFTVRDAIIRELSRLSGSRNTNLDALASLSQEEKSQLDVLHQLQRLKDGADPIPVLKNGKKASPPLREAKAVVGELDPFESF